MQARCWCDSDTHTQGRCYILFWLNSPLFLIRREKLVWGLQSQRWVSFYYQLCSGFVNVNSLFIFQRRALHSTQCPGVEPKWRSIHTLPVGPVVLMMSYCTKCTQDGHYRWRWPQAGRKVTSSSSSVRSHLVSGQMWRQPWGKLQVIKRLGLTRSSCGISTVCRNYVQIRFYQCPCHFCKLFQFQHELAERWLHILC